MSRAEPVKRARRAPAIPEAALLEAAGISWDVWRPSDLQSGRVLRELEAIR